MRKPAVKGWKKSYRKFKLQKYGYPPEETEQKTIDYENF